MFGEPWVEPVPVTAFRVWVSGSEKNAPPSEPT